VFFVGCLSQLSFEQTLAGLAPSSAAPPRFVTSCKILTISLSCIGAPCLRCFWTSPLERLTASVCFFVECLSRPRGMFKSLPFSVASSIDDPPNTAAPRRPLCRTLQTRHSTTIAGDSCVNFCTSDCVILCSPCPFCNEACSAARHLTHLYIHFCTNACGRIILLGRACSPFCASCVAHCNWYESLSGRDAITRRDSAKRTRFC
jgi:hypothetical protein